jgi:hypothetical protein
VRRDSKWNGGSCTSLEISRIAESKGVRPFKVKPLSEYKLESTLVCSPNLHKMVQALANGKEFHISSTAADSIFRVLGELFRHPYFGRAWIVQEMVLARSLVLVYGKDCIQLAHLNIIALGQNKDLISSISSFSPGSDVRKQRWTHTYWQLGMDLAQFMEHTTVTERLRHSLEQEDGSQRLAIAQIIDQDMSLGAKNPRDRIYALLSLASDSTVSELQPNYSLAVSNKEIFTKISWHYLQEGRHLNLFLSAGLAQRVTSAMESRERTLGLPSWAYDFEIGPNRAYRLENWAANIERNRVAGLTCSVSPNMEQLSIYGTIIDQVAFVLSRVTINLSESEKLFAETRGMNIITEALDQIWDLAQRHVPERYPSEVAREEAYWRTMLLDRLWGQTPAPPKSEAILSMVSETEPQLAGAIPPNMKKHKALQELSYERAQEAIRSVMLNVTRTWVPYTFVVLKSGYVGWAPHNVQANDVFCLFDGCIVPFVIRPTRAADIFNLVGDGYVHGFLPGQQPGVEGRPKEWIELV